MISERLKKTILTRLKLKDFDLQDETLAGEVPGWDSLSHIEIILAVEQEYQIRFSSIELLRLKKVGDLQILLDKKTGS